MGMLLYHSYISTRVLASLHFILVSTTLHQVGFSIILKRLQWLSIFSRSSSVVRSETARITVWSANKRPAQSSSPFLMPFGPLSKSFVQRRQNIYDARQLFLTHIACLYGLCYRFLLTRLLKDVVQCFGPAQQYIMRDNLRFRSQNLVMFVQMFFEKSGNAVISLCLL